MHDSWITGIHQSHYQQVCRLARYLLQPYGASADADDIAQEVFEELTLQADKLVSHPNIAGWLLKSTRFRCLNRQRALQRETRRIAFSVDQPQAPDIQDEKAQQELVKAFEAHPAPSEVMMYLKNHLNANEYSLYVDVFEKKRSLVELAERMGISYPALRTRVCRTRLKMTRLIKSFISMLVTIVIIRHI